MAQTDQCHGDVAVDVVVVRAAFRRRRRLVVIHRHELSRGRRLQHVRVGRPCALVRRAAAARRRAAAAEHLAERGPKGAAHGAVDEEVGRVAEQDDEVADERRDGAGVALEYPHVERVLRDEQYERHGLRQLDRQEHDHDRHQHQRRAAAFRQTPDPTSTMTPTDEASRGVRFVVVGGGLGTTDRSRLEETALALLGASHRADEKTGSRN